MLLLDVYFANRLFFLVVEKSLVLCSFCNLFHLYFHSFLLKLKFPHKCSNEILIVTHGPYHKISKLPTHDVVENYWGIVLLNKCFDHFIFSSHLSWCKCCVSMFIYFICASWLVRIHWNIRCPRDFNARENNHVNEILAVIYTTHIAHVYHCMFLTKFFAQSEKNSR